MTEDISKKAIIVLVILTIIISLLSTWTVLNEVNNLRIVSSKNSDDGKVRLNILPNDNTPEENASIMGTGFAIINIKESK
jgi:hypothetical protein